MKVFRFMSKNEFDKFNSGKTLYNTKNHKLNSKTNSIGFCFLNLDDFEPEEAMHFLSGIVSFEVCAIFDVDEKYLTQTHGIYAKTLPSSGDFFTDLLEVLTGNTDKFEATEYCTEEYNNKIFKLDKYTTDCWKQWNPIKEKQNLCWRCKDEEG